MATISSSTGSTLDVNSIVTQLMQVEQRPLTRLDKREASYQSKLSAYGNLSSAVSAFQTAMNGMSSPASLLSLKVSASDSSIFSASAAAGAIPGTYTVEVSKLAQQQKLVATGQISIGTSIGSGTLTLDWGTISGGTLDTGTGIYSGAAFAATSGSQTSITIDSSNNTLSGIRDAINSAKAGVTASIVNDGGATPYHLVLTSDKTGATNSLKISVSGDAALSILLAHNPAGTQNLSQKSVAQDAELKVDGVLITKSSNSVSDAINGVTLNLAKTNINAPASLTVTRDISAVQGLAQGFANAYNAFQKSVRSLASYDANTKTAGPLYADGTTGALAVSVRSILSARLSGSGTYANLSQLGLSFQRDGTLKLDTAKLQAAVSSAPEEVAAAFAQSGRPTDSMVSYAGASSATKAGDYAVNVSQLATRGTSVGSAVANLTIAAADNDVLSVSIDGVTASVTLSPGTYASADALADEVQTRINAAAAFVIAGVRVTASSSAGAIKITSQSYGTESNVLVSGGKSATDLLGNAPTNTTGFDVAGTIGSVVGVGKGQALTGFGGSPSDGLQVAITGGNTGARGTVSYSRGFAYQLSQLAARYLEPAGTIANRTTGISTSITNIGKQRDALASRLAITEQRYRQQYSTLDGLLSKMQSTQTYLTQQMDALANLTSSRN